MLMSQKGTVTQLYVALLALFLGSNGLINMNHRYTKACRLLPGNMVSFHQRYIKTHLHNHLECIRFNFPLNLHIACMQRDYISVFTDQQAGEV